MRITKVNSTYSVIETDDITIKHYLIDVLSIHLPGYKFMPSVKAGLSDGKKKFFSITPQGSLIVLNGLVELIKKKLDKKEYKYSEHSNIEEEELLLSDKACNDFIESLGLPFDPYPYQKIAFQDAINTKTLVLLMCTGSGKSLVIYMIIRFMQEHDMSTVLVVPNINLLEQMKSDFSDYSHNDEEFLDSIQLLGGGNKIESFENDIAICTWQSLSKKMNLFANIDCIIVDEVHGAKASVISSIIQTADTTKYKLGLTGTLPELYIDKLQILGTIGPNKEYISAKELIDKGLGTPISVSALFLNYPAEEIRYVNKKCSTYQQEMKYITEHTRRTKFIANLTQNASNKFGNTLCLFAITKHGENIYEAITGVKLNKKKKNDFKYQSELGVFFINGEVKGEVREEIRKYIQEANIYNIELENGDIIKAHFDSTVHGVLVQDIEIGSYIQNSVVKSITKQNVIIVGNYAVLATGINIPALHNMVFASPSKSDVRIRQSLGRGIRKHSSKTIFRCFDVIDDLTFITRKGTEYTNYAMKHWESRNETYFRNAFDVIEKEMSV